MSSLLQSLHETVAGARAAGASDAEASAERRALGTSRFANSALTQAGVLFEQRTRVRAAVGTRVGAATTSGLDSESLAEAARRAVENARLSPEQDSFAGFARPDPARRPLARPAFYAATAAYGPEQRAAVLAPVFARAARDGLTCAGGFVTGPRRRAVVTSGGVALEHELTEAALSIIALDGDASGYAVWTGTDIGRLDAAALAEEACRTAVAARDPLAVEPGAHDVVLSPSAVSELLEWMAMTSFSARTVLDGGSLLCEEGQTLCDERITLIDDVGFEHPDAVPWPFDTEGTVRERVAVLEAGRAGRAVSDRATAGKLGLPATGHAAPFGIDLWDDPVPANLVMSPGGDSLEELVAKVERGLFVTRFHYVNGLLDTRKATTTGMTRDGTFLIQDGKLGRAVSNLRFTESMLEAFGRLGGIGRELQAVPTHWLMAGNYLCPALLLRQFHFTGRSR